MAKLVYSSNIEAGTLNLGGIGVLKLPRGTWPRGNEQINMLVPL